jgi:hypothetical protein
VANIPTELMPDIRESIAQYKSRKDLNNNR